MKRRSRIYVAGPLNTGMTTYNVHRAFDAACTIKSMGYEWFLPHLNLFLETYKPMTYEEAMEHDLHWLALCDALFLLPGESKGADQEVEYCKAHGIPVFTSYSELTEKVPVEIEE